MVVELLDGVKNPILHINGYLYYKSQEKKGRINWKCKEYPECKARAVTMAQFTHGQVVEVVRGPDQSPHENHAPNFEAVEARRLKNNLKRRAESHPEAPPAQLLRTELQHVPSGILSQLPERSNLTKSIQRQRLKNMPTNPTTLDQLEDLPQNFKHTLAGEIFLVYDSRDDSDADDSIGRLLIFSTKENLRRLARSNIWYVDGTFKIVPCIFFQLFAVLAGTVQVINGVEKRVALPVVFALMENKNQVAYEKVFEVLRAEFDKHAFRIFLSTIMTDFELAIINAAETMNVAVKACFFHLRQSIFRRIQAEGLQQAYNNPEDRTIKEAAQMMCATAFVPVEDVEDAFDIFLEQAPDAFSEIADYFEINYVRGRTARGRRRATEPRYAPMLWSMFESVQQNLARTNNMSEGWHNRFAVVVGRDHSSPYAFLVELQKEQADTEAMFRELDLGRKIKRSENITRIKTEERIANIVREYDRRKEEGEIAHYLRAIGYNIQF